MGTVSKLPPPRRAGILAQVRSDGYRDGWSQAAMVNEDDAYERGVVAGKAQVHARYERWLRWTIIGIGMTVIAAGYLL